MNYLSRLVLLALVLFVTACGQDAAPTDVPANVTVTAGENLVAVEWDMAVDRTYWVFYKEGSSVSLEERDAIKYNVSSPYLVTGLTNNTQYAFSVTSSAGSSPVGQFYRCSPQRLVY